MYFMHSKMHRRVLPGMPWWYVVEAETEGFYVAASYGNVPFCTEFLQHHPDVAVNLEVALGFSAWGGHFELVKYLCDHPDLESNGSKRMGLIASVKRNYLDITKYLIQTGAEMRLWNIGSDVFREVAVNGYREMIEFLYSQFQTHGWTAFEITKLLDFGVGGAAEGGHFDLVKWFVDKGAFIYFDESTMFRCVTTPTHYDPKEKVYEPLEVDSQSLRWASDSQILTEPCHNWWHSLGTPSPLEMSYKHKRWSIFFYLCYKLGVLPLKVVNCLPCEYDYIMQVLVGLMVGRINAKEYPELVTDQYYDGNMGMIVCFYLY